MLKHKPGVNQIVALAIAEDIARGDITSAALPQPEKKIQAKIICEEGGVIAGLELVELVFDALKMEAQITCHTQDGKRVGAATVICELESSAYNILVAERIILNFLGRMSGIATACSKMVELVSDYDCQLLDTRKTTPGWRCLDKYATRMGGAVNHRMGLDDAVLIKDNHLLLFDGNVTRAVEAMRSQCGPLVKIGVEVENESDLLEAVIAGADHLLLDNQSPSQIRKMVDLVKGAATTEASGGINRENLKGYADTGVDYISLGALTTNVKFLNLTLEIKP